MRKTEEERRKTKIKEEKRKKEGKEGNRKKSQKTEKKKRKKEKRKNRGEERNVYILFINYDFPHSLIFLSMSQNMKFNIKNVHRN